MCTQPLYSIHLAVLHFSLQLSLNCSALICQVLALAPGALEKRFGPQRAAFITAAMHGCSDEPVTVCQGAEWLEHLRNHGCNKGCHVHWEAGLSATVLRSADCSTCVGTAWLPSKAAPQVSCTPKLKGSLALQGGRLTFLDRRL